MMDDKIYRRQVVAKRKIVQDDTGGCIAGGLHALASDTGDYTLHRRLGNDGVSYGAEQRLQAGCGAEVRRPHRLATQGRGDLPHGDVAAMATTDVRQAGGGDFVLNVSVERRMHTWREKSSTFMEESRDGGDT